MLDWIFEGIVGWVASIISKMLDAVSGLFLEALGTDMTAMEEYFPFVAKAYDVMQVTAYAILILIVIWQLFRAFGGPITEAENPWHLAVRGALFAFLIYYAKPIFAICLSIAFPLSSIHLLGSKEAWRKLIHQLSMDHPARAPFNLFSQSSDTVKSGIILGLGTRLQVLQNEAVKQLVSFSDIDLTAPGKRKCAYYIILSDQETSMAFLSSLFFSFLFIKLTRFADNSPEGRCPIPVNLILDEFNNIGRIGGAPDGSDFCRSLSVIRSRDIRVTIAVQSLGQLQNRYPNNLWAEIIGNCDIQLMLGCTDEVTADYISDRSGDMSIQVDTTMTVKKTVAIAQVIPQYRETQGQGKRKLLTPDEVLRLPHDEMLVIIRGQNILKLTKFDYTRHPMSREMVRVSIADYHPRNNFPSPTHTDFEITPEAKPRRERIGRKLSRTDVPPVEF